MLIKALSAHGEEKTGLRSVAKKCRVPRTKFQCWFDKDFPTSGVTPLLKKRRDQFKRVFTSDLARELRGHVINLQMLSSGISGVASVSLNIRK